MRKCRICKEEKSDTDFYKRSNGNYRTECKSCLLKKYSDRRRVKNLINGSIKRNYEEFRDKLNQSKFCIKCNEYKSFENFYRNKNRNDGLNPYCKNCCSKLDKQYRNNNKEKISEYNKKYYQENKEKIDNRVKEWKKNNPERYAKGKREWRRNKYENDPHFKLRQVLSKRLQQAVKHDYKSKSSQKLLGCTIQEFKNYLERQFEGGMSWENYGLHGWHIDHIVPCSMFDLTKLHHQEECFFYTNLQPLWAEDNLSKGDKY